MMLDAILYTLFVLFIGVILYTGFKFLFRKKETTQDPKLVKLEASVQVPDSWVFVRHRGMVFPMRAIEKTEIWDNMTRGARNEQVDAMKKAIRQGKIRAHQLDADTCCYVPLSADLKRIEADYRTFRANGGKVD